MSSYKISMREVKCFKSVDVNQPFLRKLRSIQSRESPIWCSSMYFTISLTPPTGFSF